MSDEFSEKYSTELNGIEAFIVEKCEMSVATDKKNFQSAANLYAAFQKIRENIEFLIRTFSNGNEGFTPYDINTIQQEADVQLTLGMQTIFDHFIIGINGSAIDTTSKGVLDADASRILETKLRNLIRDLSADGFRLDSSLCEMGLRETGDRGFSL